MAWTKTKTTFYIMAISLLCISSVYAQESLWKTTNEFPNRAVPAYSGGLSPFPQKQQRVDEIEFEKVSRGNSIIETIDEDELLSDSEKRLMLTTSILAELKAFLSEESVFVPNLDKIVVEATAKANGEYRALIQKRWRSKGDTLRVPVDEALGALELLSRLRDVDEQIAETVESAVLERTEGKSNEIIKIVDILEDRVVFEGADEQTYLVNFIKAPF